MPLLAELVGVASDVCKHFTPNSRNRSTARCDMFVEAVAKMKLKLRRSGTKHVAPTELDSFLGLLLQTFRS